MIAVNNIKYKYALVHKNDIILSLSDKDKIITSEKKISSHSNNLYITSFTGAKSFIEENSGMLDTAILT